MISSRDVFLRGLILTVLALVVDGLLFAVSGFALLLTIVFGLGLVSGIILEEGFSFSAIEVLDFVLFVFGWHVVGLYWIIGGVMNRWWLE